MFLDEARIAATLNHPNIVQIVRRRRATARATSSRWSTSHGEDLRSLVRRIARRDGARLPLEHALERSPSASPPGCTTRTSKLDRDGQPLEHRAPRRLAAERARHLRRRGQAARLRHRQGVATGIDADALGQLKGKVPYMSPEQCRGEPLDRRSDIFALGILLYELTTGPAPVPRRHRLSDPEADRRGADPVAARHRSGVRRTPVGDRDEGARARSGAPLRDGARAAGSARGAGARPPAAAVAARARRLHAGALRRQGRTRGKRRAPRATWRSSSATSPR